MTLATLSSGSMNAKVETSLCPGWWVKPPPPSPQQHLFQAAGIFLASSCPCAWPPHPAKLPSGCAGLFHTSQLQLTFDAALRGAPAAAAVPGCIYFCLRSLNVNLPVADQQQPVQQVIVGTSDEQTTSSFLPDPRARTGTERNIFQHTVIYLFSWGFLKLTS